MGKMVEYNMPAFNHAPPVRLDEDFSSILREFKVLITCMSSLGLLMPPKIENCPSANTLRMFSCLLKRLWYFT